MVTLSLNQWLHICCNDCWQVIGVLMWCNDLQKYPKDAKNIYLTKLPDQKWWQQHKVLWGTFCELVTSVLPLRQGDVSHQPGACFQWKLSIISNTTILLLAKAVTVIYNTQPPLMFSQSFPVLPDTIDLVTPESQGSPYNGNNKSPQSYNISILAALAVSQKALQELHQQQEVCRWKTSFGKVTTTSLGFLNSLWRVAFIFTTFSDMGEVRRALQGMWNSTKR